MSRICLCCGKRLDDTAPSIWHSTCIKRFFGTAKLPEIDLDDALTDTLAMNQVSEGEAITGVQKKFSLTLGRFASRKTIPYKMEYIVKTPDKYKPYLIEYEFVGMSLASICGFKTVPYGMLYSTKGEPFYISKRIDRVYENGQIRKIPMEDFAQLSLVQTEYKYNGSYERCAKHVIDKYSATSTLDKIEFFRMVFFSYCIGNTDMHLKNFSLYKTNIGYVLTPFYDILPVLMIVNQIDMALSVNGKQRKLTKNDFLSFGESIGIGKDLAKKLMMGILSKKEQIDTFLDACPLPIEEIAKVKSFIHERFSSFEL